MTDCRKFLLPGGDVHPQEKGQQELHDPVEATPRKPTSTPTIRQQAPPQALIFLWVPLTWGTSSTHLPSCFLATLVPNSLEKKKRESSFKSSTSNFGDLWVGDLQGLHVVGTQCTVVAVGDTVRTTDLLQDEGAGCDGFAAWGLSQVCGAIKLGRKSNNAGPAAGSWERASATVCLLSSSRFWKLLPEENQGLF